MGESRDFGEAAEGEGEDIGVGGEGFARSGVEREIEENFVDDESEVVFFAKGVEAVEFFGLDVGTRGIVGMDEENGASTGGNSVFEGLEIDEPAMSVGEGIGHEADILETGEKFEEGVAGLGKEKFIAGIREEAEGVRVGFAGAGGEKDGIGVDGGLVIIEIVAGHFAAGGERPFGLRIVDEGGGILERSENDRGIVVEAALRGIRGGEIEEGSAGGAELFEGDREGIVGEGPVGASGEHEGESF